MIRIIVRTVGAIPAGDWPTETFYKTFLVADLELEAYLSARVDYGSRTIIGGEVVKSDAQP